MLAGAGRKQVWDYRRPYPICRASFSQVPAGTDLGMNLDRGETLLDLADQLRCGPTIVLGDEALEFDEILFGAFGQAEASRPFNRSSPLRMMRS